MSMEKIENYVDVCAGEIYKKILSCSYGERCIRSPDVSPSNICIFINFRYGYIMGNIVKLN